MELKKLEDIFINSFDDGNKKEIDFSINSQPIKKKCVFNHIVDIKDKEDDIKILDGAGEIIFSANLYKDSKTIFDNNHHLLSLSKNGKRILNCKYENDKLTRCNVLERTEYIFEYSNNVMTNYFENEERDGSVFSKYHKFEYFTEGNKNRIVEKVYLNDYPEDKDKIIKRKEYLFLNGVKVKEETDFLEKHTEDFGYKEICILSDDSNIWFVRKETIPDLLEFSKFEEELIIENKSTNQNWYFKVVE